jgi:hypothetical protein
MNNLVFPSFSRCPNAASRVKNRGAPWALAPELKALYSTAMQAHTAETTLSGDGVIALRDIPFRCGESVEIIILPFAGLSPSGSRYPLRGTPVTFLDLTEPVADADWEARS